jgi:hypothetical protein
MTNIEKLKAYIFPSLLSLLWLIIWHDISEMKSDIKMLLQQSSVDKTKIENLERMVYGKVTALNEYPHDKYFKHEEFFNIKKYIL